MATKNYLNNSERKYHCKFCSKSFTRSSILTDHLRVHTGEKPFQCQICLRSFSQIANLNRHYKVHNKTQTFKCKYCDLRFSQMTLMLNHESKHTSQEIRDYSQEIVPLAYSSIPLGNQTVVLPSLNVNSNPDENLQIPINIGNVELSLLSKFPSNINEDVNIFSSNQILNTNSFEKKMQTNVLSADLSNEISCENYEIKTENERNFLHKESETILVSEESEDSTSFDEEIDLNCMDVQIPRIKSEITSNIKVDSRNCFSNLLETKDSSFDHDLQGSFDEVIDIKPDLSSLSTSNIINQLSSVNNNYIDTGNLSLSAVQSLSTALNVPSSSQNDFSSLLHQKNFTDNCEDKQITNENIQYLKSENEFSFENNNLPKTETKINDFNDNSSDEMKLFDNHQLNLSFSETVQKCIPFEKIENEQNKNNEEICNKSESDDIILLSPSDSLKSTSDERKLNILNKSIENNSVDNLCISYKKFDDERNQDAMVASCESTLGKNVVEDSPENEFDSRQEMIKNEHLVIESVYSINDTNEHGSIIGKVEPCENLLLPSLVRKEQDKITHEKMDFVDLSLKETDSEEQHKWSVPLIDIQEITNSKHKDDEEKNLKILESENKDSQEVNTIGRNNYGNKMWDSDYLEMNSQEVLLQSTSNLPDNDGEKIQKHAVTLENCSFTCSYCKEEFSSATTLLSHFCSKSDTLHSLNNPFSSLVQDVEEIKFVADGESSEKVLQIASKCTNFNESQSSQIERLTCKYCNKHFSQSSFLLKHIEGHIDMKTSSVCDHCQKPFPNLTNRNGLDKKKQESGNKMFQCEFCEKSFLGSFQLLNHLKYHARSIQRTIKALEGIIQQNYKKRILSKKSEKSGKKSLQLKTLKKQKYLKMKPKSIQLSKKNVDQINKNSSVVQMKKSQSEPKLNVSSSQQSENLKTIDKKKIYLVGKKCIDSTEVCTNLSTESSDYFLKSPNIGNNSNISSKQDIKERREHIEQTLIPSNIFEEQQSKMNNSGIESFRSGNISPNSEAPNISYENILVPSQTTKYVSDIDTRENLPQNYTLSTQPSFLLRSHRQDKMNSNKRLLQTDMQTGFQSHNVERRNEKIQNIPQNDLVIPSHSAKETSKSICSNAAEKSVQYICKVCSRPFKKRFLLIKHLQTHTGEKPYKCEFCPKLFSQLSNLNRHKKSHLPLGMFPCKYCQFKTSSIADLNLHNKKYHMGTKPYLCKVCGKRFSRSNVLTEHIRIHTGEKPFICEVCKRGFSQATNLNRHMKVHVPGKDFRCRYCNCSFKQYWLFRKHLKSHIPSAKISSDDPIRKKRRQPNLLYQTLSRSSKSIKNNNLDPRSSENPQYKRIIKIKPFGKKPVDSQDSLLIKGTSFQRCRNIQPHEESLSTLTAPPEILTINAPLVSVPKTVPLLPPNMPMVVTPTHLVPNFCHESFQQDLTAVTTANKNRFLHKDIPSNYPFFSTSGQTERSNQSSGSLSLGNCLGPFDKHKPSASLKVEGNYNENNNNNGFVDSGCQFFMEANEVNKNSQSKDYSQSLIRFEKNYQNKETEILLRVSQTKINPSNPNLFIDNHEIVKESHKNQDATKLVNSFNAGVKVESDELHIKKQVDFTAKSSHSFRSQCAVPLNEFSCPYCNKLFHHSQVLSRHLRSHHKSETMMTFSCQLCHSSFPDSDALNRHRKICSQLSLRYFCNLCKERFTNSLELNRHRQRKHSVGVKRHSCCYCPKVFARNHVLIEHIRTHTGEKPFVCELCSRPFSQVANLKRHQKIHARNGSFICKVCKASFNQFSFLSQHLRIHTKEKTVERHQLGKSAVEREKLSRAQKIYDCHKNKVRKIHSKTGLITTKDSANIGQIPPTKTLNNNNNNNNTEKIIVNPSIISQHHDKHIKNYDEKNICQGVDVNMGTNSEILTLHKMENSSISSNRELSLFTQTHNFKEMDNTLESLTPYASTLATEQRSKETRKDLSLHIANKIQEVITPNIPIFSSQNQFSTAVPTNFFQQQKDCLEVSGQPPNNINLSIVKTEEGQLGSYSSGSGDQANFQSYDTNNLFCSKSSIARTPDLKTVAPSIEQPKFASELITPIRKEKNSAIQNPNQNLKHSRGISGQKRQSNNLISSQLEAINKTVASKGNLSYCCKFCKAFFLTSRQLYHHQKLKHPQMKCHQCKYCGRFFARATVLTEHIRTHTGEKPFVCNVCNRPFSQMTNLKRHKKIHERKSIACRYCKAIFKDYSLLLKHMHTHGKELEGISKSFKSADGLAPSEICTRISDR